MDTVDSSVKHFRVTHGLNHLCKNFKRPVCVLQTFRHCELELCLRDMQIWTNTLRHSFDRINLTSSRDHQFESETPKYQLDQNHYTFDSWIASEDNNQK